MNATRISKLKKGDRGVIKEIMDSTVKQRLIEMGLLPGTPFQISSISPFGDPIAIRLKDFAISVRLSDGDLILVETKEKSSK